MGPVHEDDCPPCQWTGDLGRMWCGESQPDHTLSPSCGSFHGWWNVHLWAVHEFLLASGDLLSRRPLRLMCSWRLCLLSRHGLPFTRGTIFKPSFLNPRSLLSWLFYLGRYWQNSVIKPDLNSSTWLSDISYLTLLSVSRSTCDLLLLSGSLLSPLPNTVLTSWPSLGLSILL